MAETAAKAEDTVKKGDTVIVALDGSEFSDYAFQFYMEDLHKPGNNVILAHSTEYKCTSSPAVTLMSGDPVIFQTEIKKEEEKTDILVEKMTAKLSDLSLDAKIERIHGEAGHAVVHLAHTTSADYIVVGCRGKGTVRRTFTGSVTDYIVHHSHVPVLVARNKEHIEHHKMHFHLNPFHHHHHHHKHGDHGDHGDHGEATKSK